MKKLITLLVLAFVSQTLMAQTVDYGIQYIESSCKYEAYAVANGSFSPALAGSALFTVAVPSGMNNSAVSSISSTNGGTWSLVSSATTSSTDYYAISLSASGAYGTGAGGSISSGDTIKLFTFDLDNDVCASNVRPWVSSDGVDPASQGLSYENSFSITATDRYDGNATSTVPLTDPNIASMVPNCVGTTHGINVSASGQGPAASCGSLSYSWTGPNSFTATTPNITVPDHVSSIGSYTLTVTDDFGCETDNSLTLDSSNCFTAPVPVSLVSFDGIRVKEVNKLFWTTATEINNSHFEVQRKIGNGTFEFLGRVDTKAPGGNSTGNLHYTFNDHDMHQPGVDVFYMLKQVDFDNTVEFFGPVRISTDEANEVTVYPNPANNVVNITGMSNEFAYKVTVSDMLGKSIINSEIDAQNAKVDVSTLGNGVYNVLVTDENGIQSSTKVVISH